MKKHNLLSVFGVGIVLVVVSFCLLSIEKSPVDNGDRVSVVKTSAANDTLKKIIISYRNENKNEFQLVYQSDGRLTLRVPLRNIFDSEASRNLDLLKSEVKRITAKITPLGESGYKLRFSKGHPIWGPYSSFSQDDGDFVCLFFAERAKIVENTILAYGQEIYSHDDISAY